VTASLCGELVVGDDRLLDDPLPVGAVSCRIDLTDLAPYQSFRKERAVPNVVVYGDAEEKKTAFLIQRLSETVRRKFPRGQFRLISFLDGAEAVRDDGQLSLTVVASEAELQESFREADILLLLSPGGLCRHLVRRACAARFPIITNGFDYDAGENYRNAVIRVIRDSYSALADAIIRLADDDLHYRRLTQPR
jgi:glycosyltransferase involved in cell wall biosynthesis